MLTSRETRNALSKAHNVLAGVIIDNDYKAAAWREVTAAVNEAIRHDDLCQARDAIIDALERDVRKMISDYAMNQTGTQVDAHELFTMIASNLSDLLRG